MTETREELLAQYNEAKKRKDTVLMARIVAKAYGLGFRKRENAKPSLVELVQDTLLK